MASFGCKLQKFTNKTERTNRVILSIDSITSQDLLHAENGFRKDFVFEKFDHFLHIVQRGF